MNPNRPLLAAVFLPAILFAFPPAHAAQGYDGCVGFIDTLPTWISTQGVWCLRHDLTTNISSGDAITIGANNITIDCNDFKIGGLAAGDASTADGIRSDDNNATIRHCNIRGFYKGIELSGSGHLVEDNRLDNNLVEGISVDGDHNVVRRNRIFDTGGSSLSHGLYMGMDVSGADDVVDNLIDGVFATVGNGGNANTDGIYADRVDGVIAGNHVRGLVPLGTGHATGIFVFNFESQRTHARDNEVIGNGSAASLGIDCYNASASARDNTVSGFTTAIDACTSSGNLVVP